MSVGMLNQSRWARTGRLLFTRTGFALIAVAVWVLEIGVAMAVQSSEPPGGGSVDGIYTNEQSTRGQAIYEQECVGCHQLDLTGYDNAPALAGDEFRARWNGHTMADLFERVRTSMPVDSPGRLSRQAYSDVIAYLLRENGFPAGDRELGTDTSVLRTIRWPGNAHMAPPK